MKKIPLILSTLGVIAGAMTPAIPAIGTMLSQPVAATAGAVGERDYLALDLAELAGAPLYFSLNGILENDNQLYFEPGLSVSGWAIRRIVVAHFDYKQGVTESKADQNLAQLGLDDRGWVIMYDQTGSWSSNLGFTPEAKHLSDNATKIIYFAFEYAQEGTEARYWVRGKANYRRCQKSSYFKGYAPEMMCKASVKLGADGVASDFEYVPARNWSVQPFLEGDVMPETWEEEWQRTLQAEITSLEEALARLRQQKQTVEQELAEANQANATLETEMADLNVQLETLEAKLKDWQTQVAKLEAELELWRSNADQSEVEAQELLAQIAELTSISQAQATQIEDLEVTNHTQMTQIQELEEAKQAQAARIVELERQLAAQSDAPEHGQTCTAMGDVATPEPEVPSVVTSTESTSTASSQPTVTPSSTVSVVAATDSADQEESTASTVAESETPLPSSADDQTVELPVLGGVVTRNNIWWLLAGAVGLLGGMMFWLLRHFRRQS